MTEVNGALRPSAFVPGCSVVETAPERLTVLDLFSGIGGFSLGLERAGFETVAFCEINTYRRAVLAQHWPEVPCYDDVRALTAGQMAADGVGHIDLISAGFPCQGISIAGKGAGLADGRSGLWSEIVRLAGELRPGLLVLENTSALLSGGRGEWCGRVLGDLAALGYDAEWHGIPAYYLGSPQPRDRVWIVAHAVQSWGSGWRPNWAGGWTARAGQAGPHGWRSDAQADDQLWPEPAMDRVAHGLPGQVDRINALGDTILPQIAEFIGASILAAPPLPQRIAA